ncbi:hypothetical protein [Anaeroselena agilis]|uniref:Uncharacterized protein n=1 Tax=Anaeroselena agilis TaxID=3063788 RepID=A0ABU3NYL7_9FIRM|nr:hypothetical protein [Selenomonadales bacterium 4137-cl]
MQYRPFWSKLFDPRLPGALIAVIVLLFLTAVLHLFGLIDAIGRQNWPAAGIRVLSFLLYALPAYGLLKLNRWARLFEIGYSMLMVALGFIIMVAANLFTGVFIIITHGIVGIYLLSAKSRALFQPPRVAGEPPDSEP